MALAPNTNPFLTGGLQDSGVKAGLQKFVPEIWGMAVQDYMKKKLVVAGLAQDLSGMVAGGGDIIHLPKHDEIAGKDLYGGDSGQLEPGDTPIVFDDTGTAGGEYQLLVNQSSYAAVSISDLVQSQSSYDIMNIYTEKLGYALGKRIETYVMKQLYNNISFNNTLGGTADGNAAGNWVSFTAAGTYNIADGVGVPNMIQTILEAEGDLDDYVAILTPACYSSLFKLSDFARYDGSGSSYGNEVPNVSGYIGKLGGVDVVVSNCFVGEVAGTITTTPLFNYVNGNVSEIDHLAGYLMAKDAVKIAWAAGMKGRVQSEYDLTSLSTRFVADAVYGCTVIGDASVNKKVFALMDAQ